MLLQTPELTEAHFLDIDTNGYVDEHDLLRWRRLAAVPELDENHRVVSYEFDPVLDVNLDGSVNVLDFILLEQAIAREMADRGEALVIDGDVIDPGETIVAFDGVAVTKAPIAARAPLVRIDISPSDDASEEEGCPAVLESSSSYPALQSWNDHWDEYRGTCGGVIYHVHVTANEVPGHSVTKHLGCGVAGPQTFNLSVSQTTQTTMKVEVGAALQSAFQLSFGVTWEASTTVTITVSDSITLESREDRDDTYGIRYLAYDITYKATPMGSGGCVLGAPSYDESGTIHTMSSQSRRTRWTCPGCLS